VSFGPDMNNLRFATSSNIGPYIPSMQQPGSTQLQLHAAQR